MWSNESWASSTATSGTPAAERSHDAGVQRVGDLGPRLGRGEREVAYALDRVVGRDREPVVQGAPAESGKPLYAAALSSGWAARITCAEPAEAGLVDDDQAGRDRLAIASLSRSSGGEAPGGRGGGDDLAHVVRQVAYARIDQRRQPGRDGQRAPALAG